MFFFFYFVIYVVIYLFIICFNFIQLWRSKSEVSVNLSKYLITIFPLYLVLRSSKYHSVYTNFLFRRYLIVDLFSYLTRKNKVGGFIQSYLTYNLKIIFFKLWPELCIKIDQFTYTLESSIEPLFLKLWITK